MRNEHKSEAIEEVADTALTGFAFFFILALITKEKTFMQMGLGLGAVGVMAKTLSRIPSNPVLPGLSLK